MALLLILPVLVVKQTHLEWAGGVGQLRGCACVSHIMTMILNNLSFSINTKKACISQALFINDGYFVVISSNSLNLMTSSPIISLSCNILAFNGPPSLKLYASDADLISPKPPAFDGMIPKSCG